MEIKRILIVKSHYYRYHVFGHVHEGYGAWTNGQTTFVNAATCDKAYDPINPPVMIKMARNKY